MKLLFIEDEPSAVEPIVKLLKKEQPHIQIEISNFADAKDKIVAFRPNIVSLDLLAGGATPEPEAEGLDTREFIWDQHFCPLIIYSAQPDVYNEKHKPHPFVKSIKKGIGSPRKVMNALNEFLPQVETLLEVEEHIRQSFSFAMRDVAPYAFETFSDTIRRTDIIKRSGRRRLAALMDGLTKNQALLASWEQYLCPPISSNILMGDILRKADASHNDSSSFRVVLTPSCDLVASESRVPIEKVLVAKCCSMREGLDRTSFKGISLKKLKKYLKNTILSQGLFEIIIPYPCLSTRIPNMAADLSDLELIPLCDIGPANKPFLRIASIDSPFREQIAWAYQRTACRPGLPDRDFESWYNEIIEILENEDGEK